MRNFFVYKYLEFSSTNEFLQVFGRAGIDKMILHSQAQTLAELVSIFGRNPGAIRSRLRKLGR